jgi:hypothetical protein
MPNAVYPVPNPYFKQRSDERTVVARLRALLHRRRLDNRLAGGADPASAPELALRARRLCSAKRREQLARTIERVMRDAREPEPLIRAQVPLRRAEVLACAKDLEALVRRLRDGDLVDPSGIVLVERLLTDGDSPLYRDGGYTLRYAARSARLALDPLGRDIPGLEMAA